MINESPEADALFFTFLCMGLGPTSPALTTVVTWPPPPSTEELVTRVDGVSGAVEVTVASPDVTAGLPGWLVSLDELFVSKLYRNIDTL